MPARASTSPTSSNRSSGLSSAIIVGPNAEVIERADVKQRLRDTTDEAVRRGVFGAPTFFVGDEMFFGNDRLPLVEAALVRGQAASPA